MAQSKETSERAECHLTYLGWEGPILDSAADVLFEAAPVADLSSCLVALPATRAARRLIEILLERAEARGMALRPPRVTTVGRLPEHLYSPGRPPPGPVVAGAAWRRAVASLKPEELQILAPPQPGFDPDAARRSLAETVRDLHERVSAAGLAFRDVREKCRSGLLFADDARWDVLARAEREYHRLLEAGGWLDREAARRTALREDRVETAASLWVIGAPDLTPIARAFLSAVRTTKPVRILVGAPRALGSGFDSLGCLVPEAWEEERASVPDTAVRVVTAPAEQADVVMEHLRRTARGRSAEDVTIGVPDRDVIPYVVERLEEEGIRTRYAEGRPVERTGPFRLLAGVAELLERGDYRAFADLLRQPDVERALGLASPGGVSDRYHALHLPSRPGRSEDRLPDGGERVSDGPAPALRRIRNDVLKLLRSLEGTRPLSVWAEPIRAFLLSVYADRTLRPGDERDRELAEVMEGIGEILAGLEELAEVPAVARALDERASGTEAVRTVLGELAGQAVPPPADEAAVELLGWLELALDDAPVLVVTGANEPHLPESVTFDPFLPHALQEALGLLDNRRRWARDLLYAKTILATRPDALFVAGRQDGDGNPLHISRLLLADEPRVAARRIRLFLERAGERPVRPIASAEGRPLELPPEPVLSAPDPPDRIAVTAFRGLLTDPYLYALERILKLDEVDDGSRELDPLLFGTLAHEVLCRYGREETRELSHEPGIRAALDAALDAEAGARYGARPLPAVAVQVEQLRRRLHAFARWQAEWWAEGWRIRAAELPLEGEGATLGVDGRPITLTGKVDRLDENERTGEWCIFDYKTSERPRSPEQVHRKGRASAREWVDLQLPLYRHLAPSLRLDGVPLLPTSALGSLRVGYLALPRDPVLVGPSWAEWTPAELDEAIERAREVVRLLRRNRFPYDSRTSRIDPDHPLAPVVGGGVLRLDEEVSPPDA